MAAFALVYFSIVMEQDSFPEITIRFKNQCIGTLKIIEQGKKYRIGRDSDNDFVIDHPTISNQHFTICLNWDNFLIAEDLNSTNGLWLNGERLEHQIEILNGDVLRTGCFEIQCSGIHESSFSSKDGISKKVTYKPNNKKHIAFICYMTGISIIIFALTIVVWSIFFL